METHSLGAVKNEKDLRDVQLVKVQPPVGLPYKFITDISMIPVFGQLANGSCVGQAHALVHIYQDFKENGVIRNLSPRYIYALCKKIDGIPDQQGTYPRVAARIEITKGCATENTVLSDNKLAHEAYINVVETEEVNKDAKPFRLKGYAFVNPDKESLKQAIMQNGLVPITISVGNYNNPILPGEIGLHRVCLFGYEGDRFFYRNSWLKEWGDNGDGYFDFSTHENKLHDTMTFLDLPNEVIIEARKKYRFFSQAEVDKYKCVPEVWQLMDKVRGDCGFPIIPTSGLRTQAQNDALLNSVLDSAHVEGLAIDLACTDNTKRQKMMDVARKHGITRIGVGTTFLHFDIAKDKPQNVTWLYK